MSVVQEDVVTSEPIALSGPVESPETPVNAAPPAPEANGVTPLVAEAAPVVAAPPPAIAAPAAAPQRPAKLGGGEVPADFMSMFKELAEGDVVIGTIVRIDKDGVLVDVGSKSEGIIRPNELSREPFDAIEDVVSVNEDVKVVVIGRMEDGTLLLSKKRADFEKAWDKVIEAMHAGTVLNALVTERVKGGLVVDLGIRGFVPASHVGTGDFKHQNLDKYVGQNIPLKVIEVDRERRKVVLSNRQATVDERESRKKTTIESLTEGQVRKGVVRRVTDYGAFIDLGGIDGLLHVSEMSWSRIKHPSEVVHNGQELDVMVLKLKLDQGRVSLGLRQILPDPWAEVGEKYKVGDTIKAKISRLVPFGAFVSLEEGVEAIIPTSELALRRVARPEDAVSPDDEVEARVLEVRPEERKMTLSIRRLQEALQPAQPLVPEPDFGIGGGGGGRGRDRDRDRDRDREAVPAIGGGSPGGGGGRDFPPRDSGNRERRPRREGGGGGGGRSRDGGGYNNEDEGDYREYKNFRANQREETFGTSLADILGDRLRGLKADAESNEAAKNAEPETTEEK